MQIHHEELSDVARYIDNTRHLRLEDKEKQFRSYMAPLEKYKRIDGNTKMLEVGTGTGWFPILCKKKGLNCKGLEISPQLIAYAKEFGARYGIDPDIELGNLEDSDIGRSEYDVIIASSVFEHVEQWESGIQKIYNALKPGGAMFFESTNRFSFTSGEYHFPLYGWLPDPLRYKLRIKMQGPDIMKLGIDFHQFTHGRLHRTFKRIGFSKVYDRVDLADPDRVSAEWKKTVVRLGKKSSLVKSLSLTFGDVTRFVCLK